LFHQDISGNSYNAQQFVEHGKVLRYSRGDLKDKQESDVCIYRVGGALRKSKEAIYSPQHISIGPIYYGNRNLRSMERKKSKYYEQFWKDRVSKTGCHQWTSFRMPCKKMKIRSANVMKLVPIELKILETFWVRFCTMLYSSSSYSSSTEKVERSI
jgi:hypothetical protein